MWKAVEIKADCVPDSVLKEYKECKAKLLKSAHVWLSQIPVSVLTAHKKKLTWPSCLQRDHQDFSLWCRLQIMREEQISPFVPSKHMNMQRMTF